MSGREYRHWDCFCARALRYGDIRAAGMLLFVLVQIVQVVVPILPGGISCLAGVLLYGPWTGFLLNYIGICIGSAAAFGISKTLGRAAFEKLFAEKQIRKFEL